jgi:hypothetical protein
MAKPGRRVREAYARQLHRKTRYALDDFARPGNLSPATSKNLDINPNRGSSSFSFSSGRSSDDR